MTAGTLPAPKSGGKKRPDRRLDLPTEKKSVGDTAALHHTAGKEIHFTLNGRDWGVFVVVVGVAVFGALALATQFLAARQRLLLSIGQPSDFASMVLTALEGSLLLALSSWIAFPLLAAALGVALAQGSAASSGSVDYKLARVYEELLSKNLVHFARPLPQALILLMDRFAAHLRLVQRERLAVARAGRVMLSAAQALRQMAASAPIDPHDYVGLASEIETAAGARRLKVEIDDSDGPIVTGRRYALRLRFDEPASAHSESLEAPTSDGGYRLTLHLFGEGVEAEDRTLSTCLPPIGPSSEARTHITALTGGVCELRVFVTFEHGAEVLQSLRIAVPVQAEPVTVRSGVSD